MNNYIKNNAFILHSLTDTEIALEREGLRYNNDELAQTLHPPIFEPKATHTYITTDFSESQLEFITPRSNNLEHIHMFLNNLYNQAIYAMDDEEYIWQYSMPSSIDPDDIKEASYEGDAIEKTEYRKYLSKKYGKNKQLICGIHYNFSFSEDFLQELYKNFDMSYKEFKNLVYMKILRNYEKYKFLVNLFLGASPYDNDMEDSQISVRNTSKGYKNLIALNINHDSVTDYISSIRDAIKTEKIKDGREVYTCSRPKNRKTNLIDTLEETGIQYIEIRNVDINPYEKAGMSLEDMYFIKHLLIYCFLTDDKHEAYETNGYISGSRNSKYDDFGPSTLKDYAKEVLMDMNKTFNDVGVDINMNDYIDKLDKDLLFEKVKKDIDAKGFDFIKEISQKHKADALAKRFEIEGFKLELSTVIVLQKAIIRGLGLDIVDEADNFIKIFNKDKKEYIKSANMTSLDNYVSVLAMENKVVTKNILENKVRMPRGKNFADKNKAFAYCKLLNNGFVIKPKSTNFGLGITIFEKMPTDELIYSAIDIALAYDDIIVEEYIKGNEYRFLVVDDEVQAVLERIPANVIGNGKDNIETLINEKNKNPLRGKNHEKPFEKIIINDIVINHLKNNNMDLNTIPKKDEKVFLRKNSNISTGGDSIDHTDTMHDRYKQIALDATKEIGAKICGVDIIIEDKNDENSNYGVLELNFNPAIYIHCYPYVGKDRDIGNVILNKLGF